MNFQSNKISKNRENNEENNYLEELFDGKFNFNQHTSKETIIKYLKVFA